MTFTGERNVTFSTVLNTHVHLYNAFFFYTTCYNLTHRKKHGTNWVATRLVALYPDPEWPDAAHHTDHLYRISLLMSTKRCCCQAVTAAHWAHEPFLRHWHLSLWNIHYCRRLLFHYTASDEEIIFAHFY